MWTGGIISSGEEAYEDDPFEAHEVPEDFTEIAATILMIRRPGNTAASMADSNPRGERETVWQSM